MADRKDAISEAVMICCLELVCIMRAVWAYRHCFLFGLGGRGGWGGGEGATHDNACGSKLSLTLYPYAIPERGERLGFRLSKLCFTRMADTIASR